MRNHRPHFFILALLTFAMFSMTTAQAQEPALVSPASQEDNAQTTKKMKNRRAIAQLSRTNPSEMKLIGVERLSNLTSDNQLMLSNGKKIKLDNIRIPQSASTAAKTVIEETLKDTEAGIYISPDANPDQYIDPTGFTLAHILTSKNAWLQAVLVSRGLAWVEATNTKTRLVAILKKYEDQARLAQLGFWKQPEFFIKNDNNIAATIGSYQVYEGVISSIREANDFYFIRFSSAPQGLSLIVNADTSTEISNVLNSKFIDLKGSKVRIHGWVENNNGPAILIKNSDQITILQLPITKATLQKARKQNQSKKN